MSSELTPRQALEVLDQMSQRAMGNAADHQMRATAVEVLAALVEPDDPT